MVKHSLELSDGLVARMSWFELFSFICFFDSLQERTVKLRRLKVGGLGLSIKGGSEHNIPILVSRIFKDQTADQTGGLFVGDAILKVNGMSIERASHDEAVAALKNAGSEVVLTVRHFRAATPYLKQAGEKLIQTIHLYHLEGEH